jgi:PAS domain S-box-containing protein
MTKPLAYISIRTKLTIVLVAMALIPLFLENLITYRTTEQTIMEGVFDRNKTLAENIAKDIDQMFAEKIRILKIAADNTDIKSMDAARMVPALRSLTAHQSELLMAIVLAPNADLLARSDGKQVKANYSDREYFHTATKTGETTISDVLVSKTTGKLDIGIAEPIKNPDQKLRGMLVIGVALQKIIDCIAETRIGPSGYGYIVNKQGKVLMHPDHSLIENGRNLSDLAPVKAAISGQTGCVEYEYQGRKTLAGYSHVPTTGWGLIVQQPLDEAMAVAITLRNTNIIIMIVTVLVAVILIFTLGGVLFKPIKLLKAMVEKVAGGDLTTQASFKSSDEIGALAAAFNNMTTQLRAREEALQQSQEMYRRIVDTSNEGIWMLDKNERTTFVNARMAKILGYRVEEIIGQGVESFLIDQDFQDHKKQMQRHSKGVVDQYECRWKRRDGQTVWTIVSATLIFDAMNQFDGSFAMITDISKRKRAENTIRDSEKRYRSIMEASPDPIVTYDMQGSVIYINPAFTRVFGWTYEEVVRKKIDYVPEEALVETQAMLKKLQRGESAFGFQTQRYNKNRNIIDIDMSFGVWKTKFGDPAGSVVILRDVTEQKKIAAQLQRAQKLEAIGTLAGGIAHDFNNILSGIFGYSQLAKNHLDNPKRTEKDIDQIIKGAHKATDLVQQILTISRKSIHKKQPLSAHLVIKEALKLLRATIPATIQIKEAIFSKATVIADPTKIHQVIMNLCTNAYHAMLETGGILSVGLKEIKFSQKDGIPGSNIEPGNYLKLEVSDTGHGIESPIMEKIFEPYFTTKEPDKGTGLGLAVVFGIVQEHKGHITVYSEPGLGTTFHVYLPIVDKSSDPYMKKKEEFVVSGSERILFVDDEENLLRTVKELLEELGYRVNSFQNGTQAFEAYKEDPDCFDIVVSDMTMPGMTGLDLAKKILQLRPTQPVVLCTGHSELINRKKALKIGISDYYEKPVIISELAKVIRTVIDKAKGSAHD